MSYSQLVKETFQKEVKGAKSPDYPYKALYRKRLIEFRKQKETVVRVDKPQNLPRARELGYKAKNGFVVARVRVRRGGGLHHRPSGGRRPKRMGVKKLTRRLSIQAIAEKKASSKYTNCEVLNSYWVGEDGKHKYYEVILVDTAAPEIKSDRDVNWIIEKKHRGRAERGLTSEQKKGRGLIRGEGHEKNFPSMRAKDRKGK